MDETYWRRATRHLFAGYLVVSGVALLFPHRPAAWPVLLVAHIGIATLLLFGDRFPARIPQIIQDWYLLALVPMLYTELAVLNVSVHNGRYFDDIIIRWEERIFGGQPSQDLAAAFPNLFLSEFLHFSYIAYYFIIYGPFVYLYLKGRRADHQRATFTVMLAFFAHYVFFIYFPVQGPRYLYAAPAGEIATGTFYNLAHQILEAGSARGAAFPSSHVGVSFAQTAMTFVLLKRWSPFLVVLSTGLAVGAVYGGFHYATDAVAGFIYSMILVFLAPSLAKLLTRTD